MKENIHIGMTKSLSYTAEINKQWKNNGKTMETVTDFILGGSKIPADSDCSHEIKRHSLKEKL